MHGVEPIKLFAQIARTAVDIAMWIKGIGDTKFVRRSWHQLRQTDSAFGTDCCRPIT